MYVQYTVEEEGFIRIRVKRMNGIGENAESTLFCLFSLDAKRHKFEPFLEFFWGWKVRKMLGLKIDFWVGSESPDLKSSFDRGVYMMVMKRRVWWGAYKFGSKKDRVWSGLCNLGPKKERVWSGLYKFGSKKDRVWSGLCNLGPKKRTCLVRALQLRT